jgi:hypothetical protein
MFTPVWRDKDLVRIQFLAHLHPLIIFRVHASKALWFTECGCHVLTKMTSVRRTMFVEVFKIWAEKISRIRAFGEATL